MLRLALLVTALFSFSAAIAACGGASGRPTLPPPDYEEPPVPSASPSALPDAGTADAA